MSETRASRLAAARLAASWRTFLPRLRLPLLLLAVLAIQLVAFDAPFIRPHEDDNARYALAARNHRRLGPAVTHFSNCLAVGGETPRPEDYYVNHPGTLSLLLALSHAVLGETEATTRLVPLVFSLAGIFLLYRAVGRRWDGKTALLAACAAGFMPLAVYVGKLAVFLPVILPLGILLIDEYGRATDPDGTGAVHAWWPTVMIVAAASVDYGALFILPALLIAYGPRRALVPPVIAASTVVALLFLQVVWITGAAGLAALATKGLARAGSEGTFGWGEFMKVQFDYFTMTSFTPVAAAVAALGIFRLDAKCSERNRFVAALLLWGGFYVLVFREAAQVHLYWQYYLIPAVAILFALGLTRAPAIIALLVLALFLDQSTRILSRRFYADTGWYAREFEAIEYARRYATGDDVVLTRLPMRSTQPAYYSDRRFITTPNLPTEFAIQRNVSGGPGTFFNAETPRAQRKENIR